MDAQQPVPQSYDPNRLVDTLIERLQLKNDAALSRLLEVGPPVISKIRHRRLPVGASILIRMHEISGLPIRELRDLMGDRRKKLRISEVDGLKAMPGRDQLNQSASGSPAGGGM